MMLETETPAFAAFEVRLDRGGGDPGKLGLTAARGPEHR